MAAALRAFAIVVVVLTAFVVLTPLQWVLARAVPRRANGIPRAFCRLLLALLRVEVECRGAPVVGEAAILAANHVSWIDVLALGATVPFCVLAKGEVGRWPVVASFAKVQGAIFVDRRRRRSIVPANRAIADRLRANRSVLIFPEGTTVWPGPARFLSSHFAAAHGRLALEPAPGTVAVQPVALLYSRKDAAWIGDDDLVSHLWRTLRAPPLRCALSFGEPLRVGRGDDRKGVARRAREAVVTMIEAAEREMAEGAAGNGAEQRAGVAGTGVTRAARVEC